MNHYEEGSMLPDGWNERISQSGWEYLTKDSDPETVADLLTKMYEIGFRGPEIAPQINPTGTAVLWKSPDTDGIPVLTSEGLLGFYKDRGHRWFILRVDQLLRGCAGPNAARLQEVFCNYEEQCKADGVEAIPEFIDVAVFVGGEGSNADIDPKQLAAGLIEG